MSNVAEILSYFEEKLLSIITSKEKTVKEMRQLDEEIFEKYGRKDPEEIRFHKLFQQQPKTLQTGISLEIDSDDVAKEVHSKIRKLLEEKAYPVKEIEWIKFRGLDGATEWRFRFDY